MSSRAQIGASTSALGSRLTNRPVFRGPPNASRILHSGVLTTESSFHVQPRGQRRSAKSSSLRLIAAS